MKRNSKAGSLLSSSLKKAAVAAVSLSVTAGLFMPQAVLAAPPVNAAAENAAFEGTGTQTDPYRIGSAQDLASLGTLSNTDAAYASAHYLMTEDIDCTGVSISPIGNTHHFSGVFDGDGHRIFNLNINGGTQTGLFSFVDGGTVRNLGLENASVTGDGNTGMLIGRTMHATVTNCYASGTVSGSHDVGGLVGMTNNTVLSNCFALGKVTCSGVSAGGLLGSINRSIDPSTDAVISNCYADVEVTGANHVGSVIGYDESPSGLNYFVTMRALYGRAGLNVAGNNPDREGLAVYTQEQLQDGTLTSWLNENQDEDWAVWMARADGKPGFFEGRDACGLYGKGTQLSPWRITEASDLVLAAQLMESDAAFADDYYLLASDLDLDQTELIPLGRTNHFRGHFDGQNHTLSNVHISSEEDMTGLFAFVDGGTVTRVGIESGTITGTSRVGAIAGRTMKAVITNCYSKADVSGASDVGGLVGMLNNTRIRNCFATGSVTASGRSAGGIAGSANRSLAPDAPTSIENTYSNADATASQYTGSIIGYDEQKDGFEITLQDVYARKGTVPSERVDRTEVTLLESTQMRDGTLIDLLNANREESDLEWLEETSGLPGFHGKVYISTTLNGEGTVESPYLISDGADLAEMNRIVSLSAEKGQAEYALANSIDLSGTEFNGVEGRFYGHFDGRGFAIRNVNIRTQDKTSTGLFHILDGALVENVLLESGEIFGSRITGGIAGTAVNATVRNSMVYAKVRSFDVAGGLVGELNSSSVENCASNGKVQCPTNNGGIAGTISHTADPEVLSSISGSYVMGHPFWGTNAGKVAGRVDADSASFASVYYSDQYKPNIGIGTDFSNTTEGVTMLSKAEMQSDAFVQTLNAALNQDSGVRWVLGEDGRPRLDLFEEAASIDRFIYSIQDQPEIREGRLVLPESEDGLYQAVLAGSDNRATVTLDGQVFTPLRGQKVQLIYDIYEKATGEKKGRVDRNIVLDVKGTWQDEGEQSAPLVIPGLREWHGESGSFVLQVGAGVAASSASEKAAAGRILSYLSEICPVQLNVKDSAAEGDIVLHLDESRRDELGEEGYTLEIADQIVITAASEKGLLYGGISIAQILMQDADHTSVPRGEVRDYPADELRGGMFDVARRFFELDYMEDIGKYMAWFKMNTLHLHLNETGGEHSSSFVLQSEKYPQINENNAGYIWSKDDYRQMQKNLHEYGVDVISEIDTPGHSSVFAKVAPELVSGADLRLGDHYDECLALIESLYDEYLDGEDPVFQHAIVNIGTDESGNTKENMRRYINDLAQYCLSKDNVDKVEFWGNLSLYYGNTEVKPENVIERVWDGPDQRVDDALENGYLVTNSTSNMMYIVPGRGLGFFSGYLELDQFYENWKGTSDFTTSRIPNPYWIGGKNYHSEYTLLKGDPQILGSFFCDWNDAGWGNDYDIFEIMMPYIGAMSEKGWYGEEQRFASGKDFAEAFASLGDTGVIANPRRHYSSEDHTLAEFDFGSTQDGRTLSSVLNREAEVRNAAVTEASYGEETMQVLSLQPDSEILLPFDGIGYPYTATMEMKLEAEPAEDAVLFQDDFGAFYANYKGQGVCFTMGKYTYSFNMHLPVNEWFTLSFTSNYIPGGTPVTVMKLNGRDYSCTQIEKVASNVSGVPSSYLPTARAFCGLQGELKSLTVRDAWNLLPHVDYSFKGEGSEQSPYRIETAADLQRFLDSCGQGETEGKHFALYADLDLSGRTIIPASDFRGVFDGNGHCISGLTIRQPEQNDIGLFCQLNGGTVRNLRFKNALIEGGRHTGIVAGRTGSHALIENVRADGTVTAAADGGLIVGMFNNGTLRSCGSTGSVSVSIESVGGLTGSANLSLDPSTPTLFENCWSAASVNGKYAGRITGWDESTSEKLPIGMEAVYYLEGNNPSGNYARTEGTESFSQAQLTDGSLLEKLNATRKEGSTLWIAGEDGTPDFGVIEEAPASSKVLLEMAVQEALRLQDQNTLDQVNVLVKAQFERALANAQSVLADEKASQFAVNEAWKELVQAIHMLGFTSDFSELDLLIARAESLDLDRYEETGKEELAAALAYAKEVRASDTALTDQSIRAAADRLQAALDALVEIVQDIDTTLLEILIAAAEGIDLNEYVPAGQDDFTSALETARAELASPTDQASVDAAALALHQAWLNLRLKPSEALLASLQNFVLQVSALDPAAYQPATWHLISSVYNRTVQALEDPQLDQKQAEELADAIANLQEKLDHPDGQTPDANGTVSGKKEPVSSGTNAAQKTEPKGEAPVSDAARPAVSASVKTGRFLMAPAAAAALSLAGLFGLRRRKAGKGNKDGK